MLQSFQENYVRETPSSGSSLHPGKREKRGEGDLTGLQHPGTGRPQALLVMFTRRTIV